MQNKPRFMYIRGTNGAPIGCITVVVNREQKLAQYQISVLNPADKFDRKIARQLALGRLYEAPIAVAVSKDASMHDVSKAIMLNMVINKKAPKRAVKAANNWLYWQSQHDEPTV